MHSGRLHSMHGRLRYIHTMLVVVTRYGTWPMPPPDIRARRIAIVGRRYPRQSTASLHGTKFSRTHVRVARRQFFWQTSRSRKSEDGGPLVAAVDGEGDPIVLLAYLEELHSNPANKDESKRCSVASRCIPRLQTMYERTSRTFVSANQRRRRGTSCH